MPSKRLLARVGLPKVGLPKRKVGMILHPALILIESAHAFVRFDTVGFDRIVDGNGLLRRSTLGFVMHLRQNENGDWHLG